MNNVGHIASNSLKVVLINSEADDHQQVVTGAGPQMPQHFGQIPVNRQRNYQATVNLVRADFGRIVGFMSTLYLPRKNGYEEI